MNDKENLILVYYIGVANMTPEEIERFVDEIKNRMIPETFKGEIIMIPQYDLNTRVECINPKYITDNELIQEHEHLMKELNYKLHNDVKELKKYGKEKD